MEILERKKCSTSSQYSRRSQYICNPLTGRWIQIGGPKYKQLIEQNVIQPPSKICKKTPKKDQICNPMSGRIIKKSGSTHKKLTNKGVLRIKSMSIDDEQGTGSLADLGATTVQIRGSDKESDTMVDLEGTTVQIKGTDPSDSMVDLGGTTVQKKDKKKPSHFKHTFVFKEPVKGSPYRADDYENMTKIGEGAYGQVYRAYDKNAKKTLVIKKLPKDSSNIDDIENELTILKLLQMSCDPYLLCYVDFEEDDKNYYIITEFLENYITLDEYIEKFHPDEEQLKIIIKNLKNGLQALHTAGVAHRDLKPGNIMIQPSNLNIKYIDFGVSCTAFGCLSTKIKGTILYMAPEIISADLLKGKMAISKVPLNFEKWKKMDYWSLGMTIMEIIIGQNVINYYIRNVLEKSEDDFESVSAALNEIKSYGLSEKFILAFFNLYSLNIKNYLIKEVLPLLAYNPDNRTLF